MTPSLQFLQDRGDFGVWQEGEPRIPTVLLGPGRQLAWISIDAFLATPSGSQDRCGRAGGAPGCTWGDTGQSSVYPRPPEALSDLGTTVTLEVSSWRSVLTFIRGPQRLRVPKLTL